MTTSAKRFVLGVAAFALFLVSGSAQTASAEPDGRLDGDARRRALARVRAVESDLVDVVGRASDASVTILTRRGFGRARERRTGFVAGAGSGVLVRYRGLHVVTNNHVVSHPGRLEIVTDAGLTVPVRVKARDTANDLAVLSIIGSTEGLDPVDLERDASSNLREGAWVVATGNPFLLAVDGEGVATLGVFSGARAGRAKNFAKYLLQHDAEINPGNSGGPLWNLDGELLGINGAIVTRSMRQGAGPSYTGTSITIPVTQVRAFLDRVLPKASTQPPPSETRRAPVSTTPPRRAANRLGLRVASSLDAHSHPDGVLVTGVVHGGLVASSRSAAPQSGDRITRVMIAGNAWEVRSQTDLDKVFEKQPRGTNFTLTYSRGPNARTWSGVLR